MASSFIAIASINHAELFRAEISQDLPFYSSPNSTLPRLYSSAANIGIHLLKGVPPPRSSKIIPTSDHLSFECVDLPLVESQLLARGVEYVKQTVEEGGVFVYQLFLHDPDLNMIEICTCSDLPTVRLCDGVVMKSKLLVSVSPLPPSSEDCLMDSCCSSHDAASTPSCSERQELALAFEEEEGEDSLHHFGQSLLAQNKTESYAFNNRIRKDALKLRRDQSGAVRRSMSLSQIPFQSCP